MLTVFERIPDIFVERYDVAFRTWAREFSVRGPRQAIPLMPAPGTRPLLDQEGRPILRGVWLTAEIDRSKPQEVRVVIRPADDAAAELIEQHVREMARYWLN